MGNDNLGRDIMIAGGALCETAPVKKVLIAARGLWGQLGPLIGAATRPPTYKGGSGTLLACCFFRNVGKGGQGPLLACFFLGGYG